MDNDTKEKETIEPPDVAASSVPEKVYANKNQRLHMRQTRQELMENQLRRLEAEVQMQALSMVADTLKFADIDPERPNEVPEDWKEELKGDPEALKRRQRVAKSGWMNAKEAPVALSIAKSVAMGISKARGLENSGDKVLNVSIVQLPVAPGSYPVIDIDDEK